MIKFAEKIDPKALRDQLVREHTTLHEQVSRLKLACGSLEAAAARGAESDHKLRDTQKAIFLLLSEKLELAALGASEPYADLLANDSKPLEEAGGAPKKKEGK